MKKKLKRLRLRYTVLLGVGIMLFNQNLYAQSDNNAWVFISHTQQLTDKFDLLADVQLRSSDHLTYFSTLLLRTALSYNLNKKQSVAFGYAYKGDWEVERGQNIYNPEHRIYEQYLHNFKFQRMEITTRVRLEQRFVKSGEYQFSQRARIFLGAQIPLITNQDFTKGVYANIQDEVFMNVQNKEKVNGSLLDQNRPYISAGYRVGKSLDIEFGYTRWLQREQEGDQLTHVMQLMITTKL